MKRLGAIAEVVFLLVAGNLFVLAVRAIGITPERFGQNSNAIELSARAGLVDALFIVLKFGCMIGLGLWVMRRRHQLGAVALGLTRNGHALPGLLVRGLALGCCAAIPWLVLMSANAAFGFGVGVAGWQVIEDAPLSFDLVVFVLTAMIITPPIMEEISFRGYARARLELAFSPLAAALVSAAIFMLAHLHFYGLDAVLIGTQITGIIFFTALAFDTYRTGTIIPAIVAHALINLPISRTLAPMLSALLVTCIVAILCRREIASALRAIKDSVASPAARPS